MAEYLNPSRLMHEGREAMTRAAEAAEQPAQPAQPAAQPPGAPPGEKFREWMSPPSSLRSRVDWQKDNGWFTPWAPFVVWAERKAPAILESLKTAEAKLAAARKEATSNSDIKVINSQHALARGYHFLEEAYNNSFKTRRR